MHTETSYGSGCNKFTDYICSTQSKISKIIFGVERRLPNGLKEDYYYLIFSVRFSQEIQLFTFSKFTAIDCLNSFVPIFMRYYIQVLNVWIM